MGLGAGFALGYGRGLLRRPFLYQPIGYEHPFEGNRRNANGFGRYLLILPKRIKFGLLFASDAQTPEIPPWGKGIFLDVCRQLFFLEFKYIT